MLRKVIFGFGVVLLLTASAFAFPAGWWLYRNVSDFFDDKPDIARANIKRLEGYVVAHAQQQGAYPEAIYLLGRDAEGNQIIPTSAIPLIDPWGNIYLYEPYTLNPKTGLPLIYSGGPPRRNKRITNWD